MDPNHYEGRSGQERLKALMRAVFAARGRADGTQEFLLGWLYGLADAGALDQNALFAAQHFIAHRKFEKVESDAVEMYVYPNDAFRRVEGKSLYDLEKEIMDGGPHEESLVQRIYSLASDQEHALHLVARHYLFLSRAKNASVKFDD